MVSIPDWPRFAGRLTDQPKVINSQQKYYKMREEEAIRQAEEHGYFLTPTAEFLASTFTEEQGKEDIHYIKYVKLDGVHMRQLGELGMAMRLKICVLSHNFLTRFEALGTCRQLVRLDLHSNQINSVPGIAFWSGMKHLEILNLHDNPMGKIENLHYLAACRRLRALTLYNTPLSLKKNYRHHVVNSIWTLAALDKYVISDEEIIEDAAFGGRFSTMHPNFYIDLCPPTPKLTEFAIEMAAVDFIRSEITYIQAHTSPVLIIQAHIKGYLTRKKFKMVLDTRIWASVTIQRFWRKYKGLTQPQMSGRPIPVAPSTTPVLTDAQMVEMKQDFDQYARNRTPGSAGRSERSVIIREGGVDSKPGSSTMRRESPAKKLQINVKKLQLSTLKALQDDAEAFESELPTFRTGTEVHRSTRLQKRQATKLEKPPKIKSVKQFFGPVVPTSSPMTPPSIISADSDEVPVVSFRLRGFKPQILQVDQTTEMIIARAEAGKDIRDAEAAGHRHQQMLPKPKIIKKQTLTNDQRIFAKVHGTMSLSCLHAVQQAYKDREKAERTNGKIEKILNLRDEREAAKHRIKVFHEERRNNILIDRQKERANTLEVLERRELQQLNYLDKNQELRNRAKDFKRSINQDSTFINDFSCQHTSVSNALLRHDRQARVEDTMQEKLETVEVNRDVELEQRDLVKKYLEHRQLMRQAETAVARASLDTKILQETNEDIMKAHARVGQIRELKKRAKELCPLPSSSRHSIPPDDMSRENTQGLDRWNTKVAITSGRVGKHHTVVIP
ncbi:uncharacterized protein LOC135501748 [Lineus longissimus]|uniref:uncharacterized protein LOC135501748 n=1 Tax=Lineus longissimus TaxID=88925 RepID=UPI00315C4BF0